MTVHLLKVGRKLRRVFVKALTACVPSFYTIVLDLWRIPTAEERTKAGDDQPVPSTDLTPNRQKPKQFT